VATQPDEIQTLNSRLNDWEQGDCLLGEQWFLHRADPSFPLSEGARQAAQNGDDLVETQEIGFCVVSQTCDIVRDASERPFINVAPLCEVSEQQHSEILKLRRPSYAALPGLNDQRMVADLDRIMTLEKALLVNADRVEGCRTDDERRNFAEALRRKFGRPAFPDDFVTLAAKLTNRLSEKHEKQTEEGSVLRSLREIRVLASPDWNADQINLMFFFVKDDEHDQNIENWDDHRKAWLDLIKAQGRFSSINGVVVELHDMNAEEYVASDLLDLDHLSRRA
jgi:hypothetical protein